jgi:hypothetical protein
MLEGTWAFLKLLFGSSIVSGAIGILIVAPLTATLIERRRRSKVRALRKLTLSVVLDDFRALARPLLMGWIGFQAMERDNSFAPTLLTIAHDSHAKAIEWKIVRRESLESSRNAVKQQIDLVNKYRRETTRWLEDFEGVVNRTLAQTSYFSDKLEPAEFAAVLVIRAELTEAVRCTRSWIFFLQTGEAGTTHEPLRFDFAGALRRFQEYVDHFGQQEDADPPIVRILDRLLLPFAYPHEEVERWLKIPLFKYSEADLTEDVRQALTSGFAPVLEKLPSVEEQRRMFNALIEIDRAAFEGYLADYDRWIQRDLIDS